MKILISGKHMDVGQSLQAHIETRLQSGVQKYLDRVTSANVVLTKEGHRFRADIHGNTGTAGGVAIKSTATSEDVYACFDAAAEKIEKQLRRYKRRLTNHHKRVHGESALEERAFIAKKYVLQPDGEEEAHNDSPIIIAEKATSVEHLSVSEAVMKMDLADLPALLFFNSANGRINVVYRRVDGNISWVDPENTKAA